MDKSKYTNANIIYRLLLILIDYALMLINHEYHGFNQICAPTYICTCRDKINLPPTYDISCGKFPDLTSTSDQ